VGAGVSAGVLSVWIVYGLRMDCVWIAYGNQQSVEGFRESKLNLTDEDRWLASKTRCNLSCEIAVPMTVGQKLEA
jgi:hypothetical protein